MALVGKIGDLSHCNAIILEVVQNSTEPAIIFTSSIETTIIFTSSKLHSPFQLVLISSTVNDHNQGV